MPGYLDGNVPSGIYTSTRLMKPNATIYERGEANAAV